MLVQCVFHIPDDSDLALWGVVNQVVPLFTLLGLEAAGSGQWEA